MKTSAFVRLAAFICAVLLCSAPNRHAAGSVPTLLHTFAQTDTPLQLTADGRGNFYGVEQYGGDYGNGSIFRLSPDGSVTTLYSFDRFTSGLRPLPLTLGADGNLYGFTSSGGAFIPTNFADTGYGTFFRLTPAGVFTLLVNFNSAGVAVPTLPPIQAADGSFYGVANGGGIGAGGVFFRVGTDNTVTVVANYPFVRGSINPNIPASLVLAANGVFYGTTYNGGANGYGNVFQYNADGTMTSLFDFDNDANGANGGPLVIGSDGVIYGTTGSAGANNAGTFFKLAGGTIQTLSSFTTASRLVSAGNNAGVAVGSAYGSSTLYRLGADGTISTLYTAPERITGVLANGDGSFLVSTVGPLNNGLGAQILRVAANGTGSVAATLTNDGLAPETALVPGPGGLLYGTATSGGAANDGTLFSIAPDGTFTKIVEFNGAGNGSAPLAPLTPDGTGNLYGTTSSGGSNGGGTFFKLAPGGTVTTLYNFASGQQGAGNTSNDPESVLLPGPGGLFYGVTRQGGGAVNSAHGTFYTLSTTGDFNDLSQFIGQAGNIAAGNDGNFYVTTGGDGANSVGTIAQVTPGGAITVVANFDTNSTGYSGASTGTFATILRGLDGNFYGTTSSGGANGHGVVYRLLAADFNSFTPLYTFTGGTDGSNPVSLIQGSDGNFYGTTSSGGYPYSFTSTIFQLTPQGTLTTLYTLTNADYTTAGSTAVGALVQLPDGTFYGTTEVGPEGGGGTVFAFNADGSNPLPTPTPTVTPTPTATPTPTVSPTPTVTPIPSVTPTPTVTPLPTVTPTVSPTPTIVPTPTPLPLQIYGISLSSGGDTGPATIIINGQGFVAGSTAILRASGVADIKAAVVGLLDTGFTLSATFDLTGAPVGLRNVVVTNPDGSSMTLSAAFTVVAGSSERPQITLTVAGPPFARGAHPTSYFLTVNNLGSEDAYLVPLGIAVDSNIAYQIVAKGVNFPLANGSDTTPYPVQMAYDFGTVPSAAEALDIVPDPSTGLSTCVFLIPVVPARGTQSVIVKVTLTADQGNASTTFSLQTAVGSPLLPAQVLFASAGTTSKVRPARAGGAHTNDTPVDVTTQNYGNPLGDAIARAIGLTPEKIIPLGQEEKKTGDKAKQNTPAPTVTPTPSATPPPSATPSPTPTSSPDVPLIPSPNGPSFFPQDANPFYASPPPLTPGGDSHDPNAKYGVGRTGGVNYIADRTALPYLIGFENDATAKLPAQRVVVTDTLDTNDDLSTFGLGAISFGNTILTPPAGSSAYSAQVDLRPGVNILVNVDAALNLNTRVVTWTFQSIDPATGQEPNDPTLGFLPPDAAPPAGEGFVYYTVTPKAGLPTNTVINNQASVVFDENAPILTQVWSNTLDTDAPVSVLEKLPSKKQTTSRIKLKVKGSDVGSGIGTYTLYASDNGGAFAPVVTNLTGKKITVDGTTGHTYKFFARATDATGNLEPLKTTAETKVKIVGPDLVGAWTGNVTVKAPAGARIKLKGKFTVTNQSPQVATAQGSTVRFYLSLDGTLDTTVDPVLGHDVTLGVLLPGASATVSLSGAKLPANVTSASGMYIVAVINPDHTTTETDYTNNSVVYGPLP